MPAVVGRISIASGIAVVVFGVALLAFSSPPDDTSPSAFPRATLEPSSDARAEVTGTGVQGAVRRRDGNPVEGVAVTLVPLFMERGVEEIRTTTDRDGRFSFEDVTVDPGSPWVAEAKFDGVRFPSDVLRAPRGKGEPVRLVVAPTTKEPKDIEIEVESLAVVGDRTGGQAVHALTVVNNGERAYAGGLRLPLLRGATAIQEGTGLDRRYLALSDDAMTSTAPILPGRHDLTYTYIVQMARDGIAVDHATQIATDRYELLVGDGLRLRTESSLDDDGEVTLGPRGEQRTYHRYVARNLKDGDRIAARVTAGSSPGVVRIVGLALAALLALVVIAGPLVRRRRSREPSPDDTVAFAPASTPVPGPHPPA